MRKRIPYFYGGVSSIDDLKSKNSFLYYLTEENKNMWFQLVEYDLK